MRKFALILILSLALGLFSGCSLSGLLETDDPPRLPEIILDSSTLTGTVEFVNGRSIRVRVSEGDSHFDGPYINRRDEQVPGDLLSVDYTVLTGAKAILLGDTVTFTYQYTTGVSEKNGMPHLSINEIQVLP